MNGMSIFGGWGMGFGWIFMLLFWILVILGIIAIIKWLSNSSASSDRIRGKTALDIVNERYARGEIDQEEYETKKRNIET